MNKSIFENIATGYLEEQEQLTSHDPYDEIKDNYDSLKVIEEVD